MSDDTVLTVATIKQSDLARICNGIELSSRDMRTVANKLCHAIEHNLYDDLKLILQELINKRSIV